jgi:hypothetical protein
MRLATIGADAVKQANKTNRKYWSNAGAAALIQKHHAPLNIIGGVNFPNTPVIDPGILAVVWDLEIRQPLGSLECSEAADGRADRQLQPNTAAGAHRSDGLDILDFLVRTQPEPPPAHSPQLKKLA